MKINQFKTLHQQEKPLLICNVWDVASAKTAEQLGFDAIGTSSAAIASMLGYDDGEKMSFDELLYIVKRIACCCKLPLTVDIEAGYSDDPITTASYIKQLAKAGIVGINIEDSKVSQSRKLLEPQKFATYLSEIRKQLQENDIEIFINARTDSFLLAETEPVNDAIHRAKLYEAAGADGLFIPGSTKDEDIQAITKATKLPVNVMSMPELSDFSSLATLGVKRLSMGNFLFNKVQEDFFTRLQQVQTANSFQPIF